ncbi:hypothetical protein GCM10010346_65250 [Streptomyces chryseus]|uniref:Uncharacterized protein n=1 Tax=Streptomyces chryseus TaxID=68186 RepID=A0ABQ3EBY4_9ACTN|nr:hypothetical protein GCM10010346_65250 [Streptomyces chryseus]
MIGGDGVRRGALSVRQAAWVDPGVLMEGQRICAATCMEEPPSQGTGPGDLVELSTPALPTRGRGSYGLAVVQVVATPCAQLLALRREHLD